MSRSLPVVIELSAAAARVLGCLVEKSRTTPDQYPLSLNALVAACNQTTNREPVVRYDEDTVEAALDELRGLELIRREKPHGGRAIKYSETIGRVLVLDDAQLAILAVLLLRGAQTPGELKARTERLHGFGDLEGVDASLRSLVDHEDGPLVEQLAREPGRKESRWRDRLRPGSGPEPSSDPGVPGDVSPVTDGPLAARVTRLEAEVADLRALLDRLADGTRAAPQH